MANKTARARRDGTEAGARLAYFVMGGTLGAVVALLFAPKSGRELREDIADATRKGVDQARETGAQLGAKAGEYYDAAASKAGDLAASAREVAARRGESLSAAIEAGKQAYREEKQRSGGVPQIEPAPTYPERD
jgi:gas vesicle protein